MASSEGEQGSKSRTNPALDPDLDSPIEPGLEFAQFAAGCFWGVELAYQRVEGVVKTEVGYSQGHLHNPNYKLVCTGTTGHAEVVRVQFDPTVCSYSTLLYLFWSRHDPTTLNRQVLTFSLISFIYFLIMHCFYRISFEFFCVLIHDFIEFICIKQYILH